MNGFNPYSIPVLFNLLCFAALALLTLFRAPPSRLNRLFLAICGFGILLNCDIVFAFHSPSASAALAVSRADHFLLVFSLPVYLQFFHTYLQIENRRWLERTAYAFAAGLMIVTPTPWYIASMESHFFGHFARAGALYPLFGVGGLLVTVYVLTLLYRAMKMEGDPERKNRVQYLLVGFGFMGFLNGLNVLPILGYPVYPPGNLSFIPLIVFGVGLFRHDLLDMGFLIEKSLFHSIVSGLLTAGFALLLLGAHTLVKDSSAADSIWLPILLFFVFALVIGPIRDRVRRVVDRRFFRRRYDFRRTLKGVSRKIVAVLEAERIGRTIAGALKDALRVENCALFDREPTGSGVAALRPVYLQGAGGHPLARPEPASLALLAVETAASKGAVARSRGAGSTGVERNACTHQAMEALGAEVALPLPFADRPPGLLLLGPKGSGRLFSPEDLDLLETLAGQTALALENARSCRRLRRLNRELEQKVAERTKDLQSALAEKERTLDQLIRSESLAALGQLVAGVAHELNNPLASAKSLVQSVAEDLTAGCGPDGELAEDLQVVDRELTRAKGIVASLLGLSRQTQTYTEPVDLNTVIADALRLLYNQYKHTTIDIVEDLGPNLPRIEGNFSNLGQVVLNVLKNAVQALEEKGGWIRLTTRYLPAERQVSFECIDSGPGIAPETARNIFKPFFTTKPPGKGTGLGLYLSHEIIRRHGGRLTLAPNAGAGARFVLTLPAKSAKSDPGGPENIDEAKNI